ncbi:MAG: hypothetical protein IPG34_17990 [Rhodocyclaceae bacterium]|nr:hypothetical protein [Rhodocyclaceae bacterium]
MLALSAFMLIDVAFFLQRHEDSGWRLVPLAFGLLLFTLMTRNVAVICCAPRWRAPCH